MSPYWNSRECADSGGDVMADWSWCETLVFVSQMDEKV